jgi:uncharacterized membrane protein YtjA (UPF0391 family)
MLKRARISAEVAMVAAFFGFSGIIQATAVIVQAVFYCLLGFSALSLLLCLFEDKPASGDARQIPSPAPQAAPQMDVSTSAVRR